MTNTNFSKEYLDSLINNLIAQGEDPEELSIWVDIFDAMIESEQIALIQNLEQELGELKKSLTSG